MPRTTSPLTERYTQPAIEGFARRYNVAPDQTVPVRLSDNVRALRWGMLAPWRGHGGVRPPPIRTALLDSVAATPVLAKAKRCIVIADGWYARAKIGKHVHAWWIHGAPGFAGVCATHVDDGVESFAILGLPSTGRSTFLPCGADEQWLRDGTTLDVAWRETEISRWFEDPSHDDSQCIAPLANPNQGTLF
ncbi:MAG: SOS response-associated peptidase family protein [Kofleriaceae bacterium]